MELALFVYLAGVVGNLVNVFITVATIAILIVLSIAPFAIMEDDNKGMLKAIYIAVATTVFSTFMAVIIPSEKTMYLMAGAYTTQAVVQSTVGKKTVDLIEQKLDEELAKLKEKK